ncbi:alpha-L-arabinofuranosidase C-terminal domain-containing protein [Streptomyces sp. NPDC004658]|uniref:alpha-L-arabinofuranosidase C-terminal domain-containing protein n=1 Tax=Streptomyces sp. NPDC004658 TaxID=3154672 RepID=UPI00339F42DE
MSRTARWRLGLKTSAVLLATAALPAPAQAEDVTDYTITVDPSATGPTIDKTMYGVFFEDINRAADGGLRAELVQNPRRQAGRAVPPGRHRDAKTGELIVKVVNAQPAAARTVVDLGGAAVAPKAKATTLAAAPDAVNTETSTAVAPRTSTVTGVAGRFTYTFPANSVTFPRIRQR